MATYPIYDCSRSDYTRDCQPIGNAETEAQAVARLTEWFRDPLARGDMPAIQVELTDRDSREGSIWAWWLKP